MTQKLLLVAAAMVAMIASGLPMSAQADGGNPRYRHVLLISIDGMHVADYQYCVSHGTCPTLARSA